MNHPSREYCEKLKTLFLIPLNTFQNCPAQYLARFRDPQFEEICNYDPLGTVRLVAKKPLVLSRRGVCNYLWACLTIPEARQHLEYYQEYQENFKD